MDNPLISELQHLIVESLALEDVQPEDIDPDEPLFGEGLGLDSIDALELGLALKKRFGVTLTAESEESRAVFKNVRSLADYIESHREQVLKNRHLKSSLYLICEQTSRDFHC